MSNRSAAALSRSIRRRKGRVVELLAPASSEPPWGQSARMRYIEATEGNHHPTLESATGEALALTEGIGDVFAPAAGAGGLPGAIARGNRSTLRSESLMTKVPSRSSTCANHVPSPAMLPTNSLCGLLSSGEVVNEIASCGLSKPCCGMIGPTQRTARKFDNVLSSDRRLV